MSEQQQQVEPPDEFLSAIYGTNGAEKVASINDPRQAATLSDLALAVAIEEVGEEADIEKVAEVHQRVHQEFIEMDRAGRAIAHTQINEFEKQAAEGNEDPLIMYLYGDAVDENGDPILGDPSGSEELAPGGEPELTPMQQAVLAEVNRRLQQG